MYWKSQTEEQSKRNYVKTELDKILYSNEVRINNFTFLFSLNVFEMLHDCIVGEKQQQFLGTSIKIV